MQNTPSDNQRHYKAGRLPPKVREFCQEALNFDSMGQSYLEAKKKNSCILAIQIGLSFLVLNRRGMFLRQADPKQMKTETLLNCLGLR